MDEKATKKMLQKAFGYVAKATDAAMAANAMARRAEASARKRPEPWTVSLKYDASAWSAEAARYQRAAIAAAGKVAVMVAAVGEGPEGDAAYMDAAVRALESAKQAAQAACDTVVAARRVAKAMGVDLG